MMLNPLVGDFMAVIFGISLSSYRESFPFNMINESSSCGYTCCNFLLEASFGLRVSPLIGDQLLGMIGNVLSLRRSISRLRVWYLNSAQRCLARALRTVRLMR
jgi:uncharacterized membrane protein YjjB (DUF3815 family)